MTDTRAAGMRTSLARMLVVAGALAGLFAMHGLGDHGAAHVGFEWTHGPSTSHMSHAAAAVDDTARMDPARDGPAPVLSAVAMAPVGTWSGSGMGVMGLCLAVLAAALLCLVRRSALTRLAVRLARDLGCLAAAIGTTSRERDPPCLAELSILRC